MVVYASENKSEEILTKVPLFAEIGPKTTEEM